MLETTTKLLCGDAVDFLEGLQDNSVDLLITDPLYDYDEETKQYFHDEFIRVCKGAVIVFSPPENQWVSPADQYLFWVKPISTKNTSKNYSRFVEMVFVYGRGYWNTTRHWSQYTNVFTDLVEEKDHPWRKPYSLIERLVLNHSKEGDIVLDPFMGSGTTGVACVKNNRNFIGFEWDEDYYYMAKKRIEE